MDDYIDKKQAIDRIASCYCMDCEHSNGILCRACEHQDDMDLIDDMSTADVQPVKHGEWDFQGYQLFKCTNCKEIFTQNQLEAMQNHINQEEFTFPNFCPNCGADMRGEQE